jgi:hypothetical protein
VEEMRLEKFKDMWGALKANTFEKHGVVFRSTVSPQRRHPGESRDPDVAVRSQKL